MVSPMFREATIALAEKFDIQMHKDVYHKKYLEGKHMVVATTDNVPINQQVQGNKGVGKGKHRGHRTIFPASLFTGEKPGRNT